MRKNNEDISKEKVTQYRESFIRHFKVKRKKQDEFEQIFFDYINKYDKWIFEYTYQLWIIAVKKIKIVNDKDQIVSFFNDCYEIFKLKLDHTYQTYRQKYDLLNNEIEKKNLLDELKKIFDNERRIVWDVHSHLQMVATLLRMKIAMDEQGNKNQRIKEKKYNFICVVTCAEMAADKLSAFTRKIPVSVLIDFISRDKQLQKYQSNYSEKDYNNFKSIHKEEWNKIKYRVGSSNFELGEWFYNYCLENMLAYLRKFKPNYLLSEIDFSKPIPLIRIKEVEKLFNE